MKQKIIYRCMSILVTIFTICTFAVSTNLHAVTCNLTVCEDGPPTCDCDEIQECIDIASANDLICVDQGLYEEENCITFPDGIAITLIGVLDPDEDDLDPSATTIYGGYSCSVVTFPSGSNGTIIGFTMRGGDNSTGGGIYCNSCTATIKNSIIRCNEADYGGGIYVRGSSDVDIENCTIADNIGEGLHLYGTNSDVDIINSIIYDNTLDEIDGSDQNFENYITVTYSDVEDMVSSNCVWSGEGNICEDPKFVDPDGADNTACNGDDDYHLQGTSPCIDAGDESYDSSIEPLPNCDRINMGAFGNTTGAASPPDTDGDGFGNACDNCPSIDNGPYAGTCTAVDEGYADVGDPCNENSDCGEDPGCAVCSMDQEDTYPDGGNGIGDACAWYLYEDDNYCDVDDDDGDEVDDTEDNCFLTSNANQVDTYPPGGNGIGDACECEGDFDCDGDVDSIDVTTYLEHFGRNVFSNPCTVCSPTDPGDTYGSHGCFNSGDCQGTNAVCISDPNNPCKGNFDCDPDVDATDTEVFLEDFGRNRFYNPCPPCVEKDYCSD